MQTKWLEHRRYAVWGLGRSGTAASNLLAHRGKRVVASDPGLAERPAALADSVEFVGGKNVVGEAEVVIVSPGLKPSNAVFEHVPADVGVISEIELAWAATDTPFIGITGTDGKTTTTEIAAHLLGAAGINTVAAGNIGTPLSEVVGEGYEVVVAEVSAFQLWTTHHFEIAAGVFTNLAADHLDYFDGWDAYVAAKRRLIANCEEQLVAFNWDDPVLREWATEYPGPYVAYATSGEPEAPEAIHRWWYDSNGRFIWVDDQRNSRPHFDTRDFEVHGFHGAHNYANFMAAASIAHHDQGVSLDVIADAMTSFEVGGHRIEFCGEVGGVAFYDDSKATNANAAMAGIRALSDLRPAGEELVVIAGGVDKGIELRELARLLVDGARVVVLIGEIRDRFADALVEHGYDEARIQYSDSMDDAVRCAYEAAREGAAVLLSPACSSFDMFDSYADRGDQFQAAVRRLR